MEFGKYKSAGFASKDPFKNLFGFILILIVVSGVLLLICLLALIKNIREKMVEKLKIFKKYLIWNGIIKSLMLTYLKNVASCFMGCKLLYHLGVSSNVTILVVTIVMGLPLVLFPIWSYWFLITNK